MNFSIGKMHQLTCSEYIDAYGRGLRFVDIQKLNVSEIKLKVDSVLYPKSNPKSWYGNILTSLANFYSCGPRDKSPSISGSSTDQNDPVLLSEANCYYM